MQIFDTAMAFFGFLMALGSFALLLLMLPITVPLHIILRGFGRRGFFYAEGVAGSFSYTIGPGAFRRAN
jgi:hypothetical protein